MTRTQFEATARSPEQYAVLAERFWATYRPSETAAIPETERAEFFLSKGREIAEMVEYLAEGNEEASRPREPETPQDRTRREQMALLRAEEEALRELVYGVAKEPGTSDREIPTDPNLLG